MEPAKVLQLLFKSSDIPNHEGKAIRQDFTPPEANLQTLGHSAPAGHIVKPHYHTPLERVTQTTHEGIILLDGVIELSIYDLDYSLIEKRILQAGDCALILNGGHSFKIIEDARFFEIKNGPYMGKAKDSSYIE